MAAATLTGDQVIVSVEEILMSKGFGLFQAFARPNGQNGLTFTYKTPERLIPAVYERVAGVAASEGDFAVVPQVDITADTKDWIKFEVTETEFASQVLADAEKARLAASIVQSIMAQLDAELLAELMTTAEVATVDFEKADTEALLTSARLALGDVIADNEGLIDAKTLGVDATRQMVLLSPKAYWRYINSFDTNVKEQSKEVRFGNLEGSYINGSVVIKHPLIGKAHGAGILHKTKAYDFSTVEGFVLVDIAAAAPMVMQKQVVRLNDFGNEEIISRYVFGKGLLRPTLVTKIVKTV